jgi:ATP-dependent helicase HrpA
MSAELVETSRLWGRINAAVKPEWAEALGAHLVKRTWSEPHWSKKRAAVMAYERVTLYGVPLVAERLVSYGKVDQALARELFIRHALVYGEWSTRHRFFAANRALLEEVEELEHRARRRDIMVDEHTLFDFYDARVGAEVVSGAHFDTWWKKARQKDPELLTFDPEMLVNEAAASVTAHDYPDEWREGDLVMPLTYQFEPGTAADGVTVDLPVATLNQVEADAFSWQVPGFREDLVVALIRSLPKQLRVNFVPAPNHARAFLVTVSPGEEPLLDALERFLRATTGVVVPREAWDWAKVPGHLRPTFRVVDEAGKVVGEGKDLEALKEPLRPKFRQRCRRRGVERRDGRAGHVDLGTVSPRPRGHGGGYPALVDRRDASRDRQSAGAARGRAEASMRPDCAGCDAHVRPRRSVARASSRRLTLPGRRAPPRPARGLRGGRGRRARGACGGPVWDEALRGNHDKVRAYWRRRLGRCCTTSRVSPCGARPTGCSAGPRICRCFPRSRT